MPSTVTNLNPVTPTPSQDTAAPAIDAKPAIIATRQRCEAEGVGLSHYILMDESKASA
jgi:modified peptide precursor CbpA